MAEQHRQFKPGVYLISPRDGDAHSPIVYFDGKQFWLPGWECGLTPGTSGGSFSIDFETIGEMIWEDKETNAGQAATKGIK